MKRDREIFIGIDVGTSGARALLCDATGDVQGAATASYPTLHPKPLWSEQEPEDWWRATVAATRRAVRRARAKRREIRAIGLTGQMHGAVFLDAGHKVLRPAILWNDQRTAEECAEITESVGAKRLMRLTCNPALTGFTAPKMLWVRKNEPRVYERTRKVLLPKDYVRFRMSGEFATDVSDASGTLLFDVPRRRWSRQVLAALDIDPELLPDCTESEEVCARVSPGGADELGVPAGTPIAAGGGDQAAGAVGNGIVRPGVVSATIGTSGVVFAFSDRVQTDPVGRVHTFCHAVRGKWHVMGVMLSAGGSLRWFRNALGSPESDEARRHGRDPYDALCDLAAQAPAGSEGLYFLPYLTGERTPHADPYARGAWVGLTPRHAKAHLARALLEGVCYGMRDSLEIIRQMKVPVRQVRVSGGGGRSPLWRQMLADVFGMSVHTINAEEGPAYGAALLAAVASGAFGNVREACGATIRQTGATRPRRRSVREYERLYPEFGRLYAALRDEFPRLTRPPEA